MNEKTVVVTREDFAEFVYNMRKSLGMGRKSFGDLIGASPSSVQEWEKMGVLPRNMDERIEEIKRMVKAEHQRRRSAEKEVKP